MSFLSLVGVELKKIRRSKIFLILLIPVIMMWIPSIINADMNFDLRGIQITPENNFFIQGFMGMVWFMIPASLVICTVLLNQTERSNKGILKMLSLPISTTKLCLAKFTVLILLAAFQMAMSMGRTTSVQPSLPIRRTIILSLSRYMSAKMYAVSMPLQSQWLLYTLRFPL